MSVIIKGMKLPQHADVNGEKDTAYKCVILTHPDNSVELVIDTKFASAYDNVHNIQRYPITEIPTPHGRLIDADALVNRIKNNYCNKCTAVEECGICVCQNCGVATLFDEIENSTTIIEAEVSE